MTGLKAALLISLAMPSADIAPAQPDAYGFTKGQRAVDLGEPPAHVDSHRAADCGRCHERAFGQWQKSRHALAWSNEVFQQGYRLEPQRFCIHCHAPAARQYEEIKTAKRRGYEVSPDSFADEGVTCAVCHVRDGEVLSPNDASAADHPIKATASLKSPEFCASCHQFNFHQIENGKVIFTDEPMQNTYEEWRAYVAAGGEGTCQSCHMPKGEHRFNGAHDRDLLRRSLDIQLQSEGATVVLQLSSVGVGHDFPTGDLFRHLTVEVRVGDGDFKKVAFLGKRYEFVQRKGEPGRRKRLVEDTSLKPFRAVRIALPTGTRVYRVRYHYGEERHELIGDVPFSKLVAVIAEGTCDDAAKAGAGRAAGLP